MSPLFKRRDLLIFSSHLILPKNEVVLCKEHSGYTKIVRGSVPLLALGDCGEKRETEVK